MIKGSQNKLVLCATAHSLLAGLWHVGKLQGSQVFANDAAGHDAFAEFLQQYAEYIKSWIKAGKTVYAYFNNTMGDAVSNLQTLNRYVQY